jgi:hypothetical protein
VPQALGSLRRRARARRARRCSQTRCRPPRRWCWPRRRRPRARRAISLPRRWLAATTTRARARSCAGTRPWPPGWPRGAEARRGRRRGAWYLSQGAAGAPGRAPPAPCVVTMSCPGCIVSCHVVCSAAACARVGLHVSWCEQERPFALSTCVMIVIVWVGVVGCFVWVMSMCLLALPCTCSAHQHDSKQQV